MRLVRGTIVSVDTTEEGLSELTVKVDGGSTGKAVALSQLVGACSAGQRVLLNSTAVDLGLGTGGSHFVVAVERDQAVVLDEPSGGHIMKIRYTPLQCDVMAVEAPESMHHETMRDATSLAGMPVVCCGLHSQVPLVAAAVKAHRAGLRVVYCMTDEAALPFALSGIARASVRAGLLDATVSCGQAFGASYEAVNLHSGLLAARHVAGADVAIVAIGPGVVGTSTPLGHGGVAQGAAINAVSVLDGAPVACLRLSFADRRERHYGVSHHTVAALTKIALARSTVAVPALDVAQADVVDAALDGAGVWERHDRAQVATTVAPPMCGLEVTTMGRSIEEDPAFFAAAFAAGEVAARLAR